MRRLLSYLIIVGLSFVMASVTGINGEWKIVWDIWNIEPLPSQ